MRHIAHCFDAQPHLRPPPSPKNISLAVHKITLSDTQLAQIHEIFDLFDTDGGGSIDKRELELALGALGFQKKGSTKPPPGKLRQKGSAAVDSIVKDGTVTRAEFRFAWIIYCFSACSWLVKNILKL